MCMTDSKPLVSIGMPVYNGERFICQALDSLLAQDYENVDLVISDNASTDRTEEICLEYASKVPRIRYYRNPVNIGASRNFNRLIALSSGKYFMFAADHDLWHPTFISRSVEILENNPEVILCYSRTMLIDANDNRLGLTPDQIDTRNMPPVERYKYILWNLILCNMIYGVFRANVRGQILGFKQMLGCDHAVLAELALRGEFAQMADPLFYRRKNRADENDEDRKIRVLTMLDPVNGLKKARRKTEDCYRKLALEHLAIIARASLSCPHKVYLAVETLLCFRRRFGVRWPGTKSLELILKPLLKPLLRNWLHKRMSAVS